MVFTGSTGKKDIEFLFPNTAPDKTYKLSQNAVNILNTIFESILRIDIKNTKTTKIRKNLPKLNVS
ncbi:hypothetical protein, partial [Campylobacter fetus]|uniref:hypothetical protein n=1 Tax=Campylobacter fetus TaxID=196 RepID=UPI0013D39169